MYHVQFKRQKHAIYATVCSLELPVEASAVEDAGDERPEEDLREEDVEEDAHPGGVPHLDEHVLPHPVNLHQTKRVLFIAACCMLALVSPTQRTKKSARTHGSFRSVYQSVVGALVVPPVEEALEDAFRGHHVHQHRVHADPPQRREGVAQAHDVYLRYASKHVLSLVQTHVRNVRSRGGE